MYFCAVPFWGIYLTSHFHWFFEGILMKLPSKPLSSGYHSALSVKYSAGLQVNFIRETNQLVPL